MNLAFASFSAADFAEYRAWFGDTETSRRLSQPDPAWLAYVTAGGAVACWTVRDASGDLVAVIQADAEPDDPSRATVCVTVAPTRRQQGVGTAALRAFLAGEGRRFAILEGRIEPDNAASIAMTRAAGFTQMVAEPDEDGMLRFALRR